MEQQIGMNPDRMRRGNVFHRRNGSPKVLVLSMSQTMNIVSTREKGSKYQSTDRAGEITTGKLFLEDFYEGVTDVMDSLYKIRTSHDPNNNPISRPSQKLEHHRGCALCHCRQNISLTRELRPDRSYLYLAGRCEGVIGVEQQ